MAENVGEASKYIHLGMTSSDILDTGLAMQMRDAADIIAAKLQRLRQVIARQAVKYKYTLIMGRSHGVHGEPSTFGLKLTLWYNDLERDLLRLSQAREAIAYGAISGAMGNFAHLDPGLRNTFVGKGLKPCSVHRSFNAIAMPSSSLPAYWGYFGKDRHRSGICSAPRCGGGRAVPPGTRVFGHAPSVIP